MSFRLFTENHVKSAKKLFEFMSKTTSTYVFSPFGSICALTGLYVGSLEVTVLLYEQGIIGPLKETHTNFEEIGRFLPTQGPCPKSELLKHIFATAHEHSNTVVRASAYRDKTNPGDPIITLNDLKKASLAADRDIVQPQITKLRTASAVGVGVGVILIAIKYFSQQLSLFYVF